MSIGGISGSSSVYSLGAMTPPKKPEGNPQDLIDKSDTDGNGALNIDEFTAMNDAAPESLKMSSEDLAAMFESMDTDGDGEVTAEEMEASREAMMQELDNKYGSLETMVQVNSILNQTQQTLIDLMDSSNNVDDDDSNNAFDFLTTEYSEQIQEYLNQAGLTDKVNGTGATAIEALINGSTISKLV